MNLVPWIIVVFVAGAGQDHSFTSERGFATRTQCEAVADEIGVNNKTVIAICVNKNGDFRKRKRP